MKVFISYDSTDATLVGKITDALEHAGLDVWNPEREILPGDNWAKKAAEALEDADAMVVIFTPASLNSHKLQYDVSYALGEKNYSGRVVSVFVGSPEQLPDDSVPWILRRLKMVRLPEHGPVEEGIRQITKALKEAA